MVRRNKIVASRRLSDSGASRSSLIAELAAIVTLQVTWCFSRGSSYMYENSSQIRFPNRSNGIS